jgi:hypothetical protein
MPKHFVSSDLTREEQQELLYDMTMVQKEGMKTHPKVTVITLKKPLRMVTSAHTRITKEKALGWLAHAMITGPKYDRCFHVQTYSVKLRKDSGAGGRRPKRWSYNESY